MEFHFAILYIFYVCKISTIESKNSNNNYKETSFDLNHFPFWNISWWSILNGTQRFMHKDNFWMSPGSWFCSVTHLCKPFSGIPLLSGSKPKTWCHLQGLVSPDLCLPWLANVSQSALRPTTLVFSQGIPFPAHHSPSDQLLLLLQSPGQCCFFGKAVLHSPDGTRLWHMLPRHCTLLSFSPSLNSNEVAKYINIY